MKYWKVTIYNPGPPVDLDDTNIVYSAAEDAGELLTIALDQHSRPVKESEEVTKAVYDANI